jgi:hypothetical protein
MSPIKLKTAKRRTSVSKAAIKKAVALAYAKGSTATHPKKAHIITSKEVRMRTATALTLTQ